MVLAETTKPFQLKPDFSSGFIPSAFLTLDVADVMNDVYGQPSVVNSTISNRYRFTGREFDEETGLYHYRARAYSPSMGRFLQRDPLEYKDSMNLMQYTKNNPINFTDPHGLSTLNLLPSPETEFGDSIADQNYADDYAELLNDESLPGGMCPIKPTIRPREPSTFYQILSGLFFSGYGNWYRFGDTLVPPGVIGPNATKPVMTWAFKGGGVNKKTGFKLPFHFHIHRFNWYKPWLWFKYTPIK